MNCCMCNKTVDKYSSVDYPFFGNPRPVCMECRKYLDAASGIRRDRKLEAKNYIAKLLFVSTYDPDVSTELKRLAGAGISGEDKKAAREFSSMERKRKKEEMQMKLREEKEQGRGHGTGFAAAGILFLLIAAGLFFLSIVPPDDNIAELLGIKSINTYCTAFSAACFAVSMVCFCCKRIVTYIKRK